LLPSAGDENLGGGAVPMIKADVSLEIDWEVVNGMLL